MNKLLLLILLSSISTSLFADCYVVSAEDSFTIQAKVKGMVEEKLAKLIDSNKFISNIDLNIKQIRKARLLDSEEVSILRKIDFATKEKVYDVQDCLKNINMTLFLDRNLNVVDIETVEDFVANSKFSYGIIPIRLSVDKWSFKKVEKTIDTQKTFSAFLSQKQYLELLDWLINEKESTFSSILVLLGLLIIVLILVSFGLIYSRTLANSIKASKKVDNTNSNSTSNKNENKNESLDFQDKEVFNKSLTRFEKILEDSIHNGIDVYFRILFSEDQNCKTNLINYLFQKLTIKSINCLRSNTPAMFVSFIEEASYTGGDVDSDQAEKNLFSFITQSVMSSNNLKRELEDYKDFIVPVDIFKNIVNSKQETLLALKEVFPKFIFDFYCSFLPSNDLTLLLSYNGGKGTNLLEMKGIFEEASSVAEKENEVRGLFEMLTLSQEYNFLKSIRKDSRILSLESFLKETFPAFLFFQFNRTVLQRYYNQLSIEECPYFLAILGPRTHSRMISALDLSEREQASLDFKIKKIKSDMKREKNLKGIYELKFTKGIRAFLSDGNYDNTKAKLIKGLINQLDKKEIEKKIISAKDVKAPQGNLPELPNIDNVINIKPA